LGRISDARDGKFYRLPPKYCTYWGFGVTIFASLRTTVRNGEVNNKGEGHFMTLIQGGTHPIGYFPVPLSLRAKLLLW